MTGLSSGDAARRLEAYGPNEPFQVRRFSAAGQLFRLFANPLVAILLAASIVSGALGQLADSFIIVSILLIGVLINFWQTYRSHLAVERLRASVAPTATVLRDDRW